jgi:hypothetical protein
MFSCHLLLNVQRTTFCISRESYTECLWTVENCRSCVIITFVLCASFPGTKFLALWHCKDITDSIRQETCQNECIVATHRHKTSPCKIMHTTDDILVTSLGKTASHLIKDQASIPVWAAHPVDHLLQASPALALLNQSRICPARICRAE